MMNAQAKRNLIQVLVPSGLTGAIREAAARDLTSNSEYVRRAVIARLRADGIDPASPPPREGACAA